jgi:hypothetical protein
LREDIRNQIDVLVSPVFATYPYREKLLAIVENRTTLPTCKTCGKITTFTKVGLMSFATLLVAINIVPLK